MLWPSRRAGASPRAAALRKGAGVNGPNEAEGDLGALAGAIVAGVGGLFALGVAPAIIYRDLSLMFRTPMLGMACLLAGGPTGWFLGGWIGRFFGKTLRRRGCEIVGGVFGGLVPVSAIILLGWYLTIPH
jgi:hypothetical protein